MQERRGMKHLGVSMFVTLLSLLPAGARAQSDPAPAAPGVVPAPVNDAPPQAAPAVKFQPAPPSAPPPAPIEVRPYGEPSPAPVATRRAPAPEPAFVPEPTLKLSYERFSLGNADGSAMPLQALHLDTYSVSRPWVRFGFEAEAGKGTASFSGATASVKYGLLGANLGFQVPGRITPFLQGHLAGGVLAGTLDGKLSVGNGVSVSGVSAATWLYTRGVEGGIELYPAGPFLLSASLGWVRSTWGSADYEAMIASKGATIAFKDVTHDSFLVKLGVGF
jgi:hypothetical protein